MSKINFENFFISTKATFKACKTPKRKPDFESESGSRYWYGENKQGKYVIRESDHWSKTVCHKRSVDGCGNIASCKWNIFIPKHSKDVFFRRMRETSIVSGKCYLSDFCSL